jgi:hypothetical protein
MQVGPDNVTQVVSDSAAACKAAGTLVAARFPHITWTPCTAHCLDLLLEDIGSLAWAKDTLKEAKGLVHFLTNHHKSLAIFRTHSELELLKPAETRFATAFMLMDRLVEVKQALEETVVDREWRAWVDGSSAALRDAAEDVKSLVSVAQCLQDRSDAAFLSSILGSLVAALGAALLRPWGHTWQHVCNLSVVLL